MLRTDWLKIATAGKTVDGRELKAEWLEAAARTYSPATYTAVVNSEHFFYPGLGDVEALQARQDEQGRMALYAQLRPTGELVNRIDARRQTFFSVELVQDFPASGDTYLVGLAITDIPASQGLPVTQFAAGQQPSRFPGEALAGGAREIEEAPRWFSAFLERIGWRQGAAGSPSQPERTDMNEQERKAFEQMQATLKEQSETLVKLSRTPDPEEAKQAEAARVAAFNAAVQQAVGEGLKAALPEALKPVIERVEKLEAQPVPGTQPAPVTGPAAGTIGNIW